MNAPTVVKTTDAIVELVRSCDPNGLIAVDGWDGSGKSTLAKALAAAASLQHIELDTFLDRRPGGYLDRLRYDDLEQRLVKRHGPVVVEGVCVREVLARLERAPEVWIYVKLMSSVDTWHPGRQLEFESADEAIADHRQTQALYSQATGHPQRPDALEEELIAYHFKWRPHEASHVVYERVESDA